MTTDESALLACDKRLSVLADFNTIVFPNTKRSNVLPRFEVAGNITPIIPAMTLSGSSKRLLEYQVTVVTKSDDNQWNATHLASHVLELFPVNLKFGDGLEFKISRPSVVYTGYRDDQGEWRTPVSVYVEYFV